jgi:VanZ family protein
MRASYWLPPLAWMAIILWLSSDAGSSQHTGSIIIPILHALFPAASELQLERMHGLIRKLGHLTEYGLLAALWMRAFVAGTGLTWRAAAWRAVLIAAVWASIDETYQSTVSSRTSSPIDVMIDTTGATIVTLLVGLGWRPVVDSFTAALLWIAAIGGAVLIVLNVLAGVPPGWLWITAPAAFLLIALRSRRRATSA